MMRFVLYRMDRSQWTASTEKDAWSITQCVHGLQTTKRTNNYWTEFNICLQKCYPWLLCVITHSSDKASSDTQHSKRV